MTGQPLAMNDLPVKLTSSFPGTMGYHATGVTPYLLIPNLAPVNDPLLEFHASKVAASPRI